MPAEKMHAEEETDVPLVRRLLAAQFPHWADLSDRAGRVRGDGQRDLPARGRHGRATTAIHWATGQVDKEQRWLPWLAPHLPVPSPSRSRRGEPVRAIPGTGPCTAWLTGENPTVDSHRRPDLLATDLAELIAALQRIDPTGRPAAGRGVPLARRDADTRTAIDALHGMVDTDAVTAVWDAALRVPEWSGAPVWLHSGPGTRKPAGRRWAAQRRDRFRGRRRG